MTTPEKTKTTLSVTYRIGGNFGIATTNRIEISPKTGKVIVSQGRRPLFLDPTTVPISIHVVTVEVKSERPRLKTRKVNATNVSQNPAKPLPHRLTPRSKVAVKTIKKTKGGGKNTRNVAKSGKKK